MKHKVEFTVRNLSLPTYDAQLRSEVIHTMDCTTSIDAVSAIRSAFAEGLRRNVEAQPHSLNHSCTLVTPPSHIVRIAVTPPLP